MSELHRDFRKLHNGSICFPIVMDTDEAGHATVTRILFVRKKQQEEFRSGSTHPKDLAMSAGAGLLNYWARKLHNLTILPDGSTGSHKTFRLFDKGDPTWRHNGVSHASEAFAARQDISIE